MCHIIPELFKIGAFYAFAQPLIIDNTTIKYETQTYVQDKITEFDRNFVTSVKTVSLEYQKSEVNNTKPSIGFATKKIGPRATFPLIMMR